MTAKRRITLQHSFILHRRPYRDSSLLIEVFSKNYGRVGLIAKGARSGKSRYSAILQAFVPSLLSWMGRSELCTLTGAELDGQALVLRRRKLLSGFYMNELVMRFLQRNDPHPNLFDAYYEALSMLASDANEESVLRKFERILLQEAGYGLNLEHEIEQGKPICIENCYRYHFESGAVIETTEQAQGIVVQGKTLLALRENNFTDENSLKEAKQLMRAIVNHHLGGRPLKTREFQWQPN